MADPRLPHDIIMDVLSRLPVKSLMRFKCVCKPWNSLISHPQFVRLHLNRAITDINHQRVLLLTFPLQSMVCEADDDDDAATVMLDYPLRAADPAAEIEMAGSCNGLISLLIDSESIILWNPSTRDAKELPKPSALPHRMYANFGLGYDSSIDDYKVVRFVSPPASNSVVETKIEVFTLKTNSWRMIQDIHCSIRRRSGWWTFSNGALHWLEKRDDGGDRLNVFISFDLATETLQEVLSLPDQYSRTHPVPELFVLRGCLAIHSGCSYSDFEVWVMKEYGVKASWTKLVAISYDTIPLYKDWLCPLYFSKNDEILMDLDGGGLIMYNLKEGTFRNLKIDCDGRWFEMTVYAESLVSLSPISNNGTDEQR